MDYSDYEVEDFLLDARFINYCLERRGEDVVFWEQWILLHPDRYEVVRQAKQLYFLLNGMHTGSDFRRDKADFQAGVDANLGEDDGVVDAGVRTIRRSFRRRALYIATAAAVIAPTAGMAQEPGLVVWDSHYLNFPISLTETEKDPDVKQNTGY